MQKGLTAKQQGTVDSYCNPASASHNNWCASYKSANYSLCTGWKHNAIKLLHKDYIEAAIEQYRAKMAEKIDVEVGELVAKLRKLANLDPIETEDDIKPLSNLDIKAALELLGKYKGMFKEISLNLNTDIPTEPQAYKDWLQKELDRLGDSDKILDDYSKSEAAIAERY